MVRVRIKLSGDLEVVIAPRVRIWFCARVGLDSLSFILNSQLNLRLLLFPIILVPFLVVVVIFLTIRMPDGRMSTLGDVLSCFLL